jgi:quinol monooxygenase YgiN
MYGTLARFQPRPGQEQAVVEHAQRWMRERGSRIDGFVADYILMPDGRPGEQLVLAVFESEASYRRNAADPEQDAQYRELRALLTADPEWTDGTIVSLKPATVPL